MAKAPSPSERIAVLEKRVRWLDGHRRAISIVLAVIVWFLLSREIAAMFLSDWPGILPALVGALFAAAVWWFIEIGFAWMIAMWETEHEQLTRDRGLPRAQLLRRR